MYSQLACLYLYLESLLFLIFQRRWLRWQRIWIVTEGQKEAQAPTQTQTQTQWQQCRGKQQGQIPQAQEEEAPQAGPIGYWGGSHQGQAVKNQRRWGAWQAGEGQGTAQGGTQWQHHRWVCPESYQFNSWGIRLWIWRGRRSWPWWTPRAASASPGNPWGD